MMTDELVGRSEGEHIEAMIPAADELDGPLPVKDREAGRLG